MSDGAYLWPISVIYKSCNCNVPGLIQVDTFLTVRLLLSLRIGTVKLVSRDQDGTEKLTDKTSLWHRVASFSIRLVFVWRRMFADKTNMRWIPLFHTLTVHELSQCFLSLYCESTGKGLNGTKKWETEEGLVFSYVWFSPRNRDLVCKMKLLFSISLILYRLNEEPILSLFCPLHIFRNNPYLVAFHWTFSLSHRK